ncbi:MAG: bifunctional oligoribonuclease/PAP phosphatase NrnA [Candidatus Firestonebacteria bacterium]|nr:bifunctional oligoribonuclease/PAP phosphatase NrnA [Candidatus Firestonebacteria bacterium]
MVEQKLEKDPAYVREFERTLDVIDRAQTFFLTTHLNPDGDGLGCESALSLALTCLGKTVTVVNAHPVPAVYHFLPNQETFLTQAPPGVIYDVAIMLECPDEQRSGGVLPIPGGAREIINLDHHVFNTRYGTVNLIDPTAAAAGEQVWDLLMALDCPVDKAMAIGIYTAIATDTGQFKYPSVTPRTHRVVAQLLELGLEVGFMNEQIYERVPRAAMRLLGMALEKVAYNAAGTVGWFAVTQDMLRAAGAAENQTENFINYVRSVEGVQVAIFFQEMSDGRVKVSFRSRGRVDVSALAYALGGGGHKRAAGVTLTQSLAEAQARVLAAVETSLAPKS